MSIYRTKRITQRRKLVYYINNIMYLTTNIIFIYYMYILYNNIHTLFLQGLLVVPQLQFRPHFKLQPLQGQPVIFPFADVFNFLVHCDLQVQPEPTELVSADCDSCIITTRMKLIYIIDIYITIKS